jgi:glutamate racemase
MPHMLLQRVRAKYWQATGDRMMPRKAIGIFDSGVGGLTVAAEVMRALPHEALVYLGDTARLPYGTKSPATVIRYAQRALERLLQHSLKAVVVACNTASAHALPALRAMTDLPVLGVVEPGAQAAVEATRSGHIGIAGTETTIASSAYRRALHTLNPALILTECSWPLLVPLAEEGWIEHPVARLTIASYLQPFMAANVDTIILGCTHYPVFKDVIADILKERFSRTDVLLVDSAHEVTKLLGQRLDLPASDRVSDTDAARLFFCTDAPERFSRVGTNFLMDVDLGNVQSIDL